MASTYSDRLKLEIMATGANANTWGTNTNNNLEVLDAFAAGYLAKSVAGSANITLTTANASDTAESSNKTIELTGALTGDIVVFIPAVESEYNFFNNTSGSQTLTIAATGHTANGIAITQGAKTTVFCDGASNYNVEIISSTDLGSLSGTLPQVSGANLTNLNASNVASGTLPDARFPATLPAASGVNLTALNATNLGSGTVADARLPTVPTSKGGTGLTSIGSAGQVIKVNSGASALEFGDAGGGGGYTKTIYTSPATYAPPASLKALRVTVYGAGGNGGECPNPDRAGGGGGGGGLAFEVLQAPEVPGPVSVTAGPGTNSFGSLLSATAGGAGGDAPNTSGGSPGPAGAGSGGDENYNGRTGSGPIDSTSTPGGEAAYEAKTYQYGNGGGTFFSLGTSNGAPYNQGPEDGTGYGNGGRGARANQGNNGTGSPGAVIVEEFV
jgi:hypothetical protein